MWLVWGPNRGVASLFDAVPRPHWKESFVLMPSLEASRCWHRVFASNALLVHVETKFALGGRDNVHISTMADVTPI